MAYDAVSKGATTLRIANHTDRSIQVSGSVQAGPDGVPRVTAWVKPRYQIEVQGGHAPELKPLGTFDVVPNQTYEISIPKAGEGPATISTKDGPVLCSTDDPEPTPERK